MAIKNMMEDIVTNIVEELLKNDNDIPQSETNIEEIIAYVLNRIPPKYTTSERGILHGKLESRFKTQQKTDIFLYTYEAINVMKGRRPSAKAPGKDESEAPRRLAHIIGEVLEESTFSVVQDIEITLLFKGEVVKMADPNWENPYKTNKSTMGYYHFWPEYIPEKMQGEKFINFTLNFKHPQLIEKDVEIRVEISPNTGTGKSHSVPIVLLKAKDGAKLDFI